MMKKFLAAASNLGGGLTVKDNVVNTSAMKLWITGVPDTPDGGQYLDGGEGFIKNYEEFDEAKRWGKDIVFYSVLALYPTFCSSLWYDEDDEGTKYFFSKLEFNRDPNTISLTTYQLNPDNTIVVTRQNYTLTPKT